MFGLSRQIFIEVPSIKSHRKPSRGSRAVTCRQTVGQTDRLTDMNLVAAMHMKTTYFETTNDRRLIPNRREEIMKQIIIIIVPRV